LQVGCNRAVSDSFLARKAGGVWVANIDNLLKEFGAAS
jgi:hypothetical protein